MVRLTQGDDIQDILSDRERILMVAWALLNGGALTDAQRSQAMGNFAAYIRRQGLSVGDVARRVGRPRETTIGDLIKGVYRSRADDHIRKLNMWIERDARARAASLTDQFVTTTKAAKDMMTVARLVRENQTMGLVLGPSGIGKSRCALAVHERYVGSVFISVIRGWHHPNGLARALAVKMGVSGKGLVRLYKSNLERVIDALRDSGRLLIIDEAAKLTDPAVELLRDLHENTGVPILLIATRDLHERIVRNADPDHGQLYSRFDVIHHLTEGYDARTGGKLLYTMDDIRQLYQEPPIRLAPDAARYLQDVANDLGRGSLRRCRMLVRKGARRARKRLGVGEGDKVTVTAADLDWVDTRLRRESSEREAVQQRRRCLAKVSV